MACIDRFIARRQVVRYEHRGCGLSERTEDFGLERLVTDLETIADRCELERFDLMGVVHTGVVAIAYLVRHPERVRRLVLWCSYARNADYSRSPQVSGSRALIETDWQLYSETVGHRLFGWEHGDASHRFAALMRASIEPRAMRAFYDAQATVDVGPPLAEVQAPTLVLTRKDIPWLPVELAGELTAGIPKARLAVLPGSSIGWFIEHCDEFHDVVEAFLAEGDTEDGRAPEAAASEPLEPLTPREQEVLQPRSRGRIRLRSADPFGAPVIEAEYLSDPEGEDLRTMAEGFRVARAIAAQPAMAAWVAGEFANSAAAQTDGELAEVVRANVQSFYHPVGTCRMGRDEAVVDH
ncbi:MAG: alpha/beta fold hydrolase, partial [Hyphomicrobiales bacterium]